jgi:hypothetical protein
VTTLSFLISLQLATRLRADAGAAISNQLCNLIQWTLSNASLLLCYKAGSLFPSEFSSAGCSQHLRYQAHTLKRNPLTEPIISLVAALLLSEVYHRTLCCTPSCWIRVNAGLRAIERTTSTAACQRMMGTAFEVFSIELHVILCTKARFMYTLGSEECSYCHCRTDWGKRKTE